MKTTKKTLKIIGKSIFRFKINRIILRRLIKLFPSGYIRFKLRGMLEAVSPDEILEGKSKILGKFYYQNKNICALKAIEIGSYSDFRVLDGLKNIRIIVEVGANIGIDTLYLVKKYPYCKIYTFEPCREYFEVLKKNICNYPNIKAYDYFLDKDYKKIEIYKTDSSASAVENKYFPTRSQELCRTVRLDDFNLKPDLLKIDTDGWDEYVLRGGVETIKKYKPYIFIEFSHYLLEKTGCSNYSLYKFLRKLGYNKFISSQTLEEYNDLTKISPELKGSINFFCSI